MQNTYHANGKTYMAKAAPFSMSINKCTGCAFHATKTAAACLGHTCTGTLRADFRDIIWIENKENTK
jgi:hypothetical protein